MRARHIFANLLMYFRRMWIDERMFWDVTSESQKKHPRQGTARVIEPLARIAGRGGKRPARGILPPSTGSVSAESQRSRIRGKKPQPVGQGEGRSCQGDPSATVRNRSFDQVPDGSLRLAIISVPAPSCLSQFKVGKIFIATVVPIINRFLSIATNYDFVIT